MNAQADMLFHIAPKILIFISLEQFVWQITSSHLPLDWAHNTWIFFQTSENLGKNVCLKQLTNTYISLIWQLNLIWLLTVKISFPVSDEKKRLASHGTICIPDYVKNHILFKSFELIVNPGWIFKRQYFEMFFFVYSEVKSLTFHANCLIWRQFARNVKLYLMRICHQLNFPSHCKRLSCACITGLSVSLQFSVHTRYSRCWSDKQPRSSLKL